MVPSLHKVLDTVLRCLAILIVLRSPVYAATAELYRQTPHGTRCRRIMRLMRRMQCHKLLEFPAVNTVHQI